MSNAIVTKGERFKAMRTFVEAQALPILFEKGFAPAPITDGVWCGRDNLKSYTYYITQMQADPHRSHASWR